MFKFTQQAQSTSNGSQIDEWIKFHIDSNAAIQKGAPVRCIGITGASGTRPTNTVGILFTNCYTMMEGTSQNHGSGGSTTVTGNPVAFVDVRSFMKNMFESRSEGFLSKYDAKQCFILPLCAYNDNTAMVGELCAEFVSQKKGNIAHSVDHIANAYSCALSAICYHLSEKISFNGAGEPDRERLMFLVDAFNKLSQTLKQNAAVAQIGELFRMIPHCADTSDVFQSTIARFLFDVDIHPAIPAKHLYSAIQRYYKHSGNSSFIDKNPSGLIGLVLVIPMLFSMFEPVDTNVSDEQVYVDILNRIVDSINLAVQNISDELAKKQRRITESDEPCESVTFDDINRMALTMFVDASEKKFVPAYCVGEIHDLAMLNDKSLDVLKRLGFCDAIPFELPRSLTINKASLKSNQLSTIDSCNVVRLAGNDLREWCAVSLKPGNYEFKFSPIGIAKFHKGNTNGMHNIANARFTTGNECLSGKFGGISVNGQIYDPNSRRKYSECNTSQNLNATAPIDVCVTSYNIVISQFGSEKFRTRSNENLLVCFKFCNVTITKTEAPAAVEELRAVSTTSAPVKKPIKKCNGLGSVNYSRFK